MRYFFSIFFVLTGALVSLSKMTPPPPLLLGIQTHKNFTSEKLIKEVFLKDGCKNVSNIKTIDHGLAVGYFSGGGNIFGLNEGVILSSGDVKLAEGPNEELESTFAYGEPSTDDDINAFATASAFDVGGIEFDFVPVGSRVSFEYAFASEEYCEFVGSMFNDVFGFFVSGPGINGPFSNNAINVALVPNTNDFVAINSINHSTNSIYYIKNEIFEEADECGIPYGPEFLDFIEYDGMTTKLTAEFDVIPCETYHIRLLVADIGDDILDSGVFLGSKTFDINSDVQVAAVAENNTEPIASEGCNNGLFVFQLPYVNTGGDIVVHFNLTNNSTAEMGVDFEFVADSVIIPSGASSVTLPINVLDDQLTEGMEAIVLEMVFPCDCVDPQAATLYIIDPIPVEVTIAPVTACAGQFFSITPVVLSGESPFAYLWDNGTTANTLVTSISQTTDFSLTVTDACGTTSPFTVTAEIQPIPEAILMGETTFCPGSESFFEVLLEGSPPWTIQYSIAGVAQQSIDGIMDTPFDLPVVEAGEYQLIGFSDANCIGIASGNAFAEQSGATVEFSIVSPSCINTEDGEIALSISGSQPPFTVHWSPSVNDNMHPTNLNTGTYNLTITDAVGCSVTEEIVLSPEDFASDCKPYSLFVPNVFSPNGDGINDEFRFFPAFNSNISQVKHLTIFNRWGGLVYEKKDFVPDGSTPLWSGNFKGKPVDVGVYVWQAVLVLENQQEVLLSGDLTLLR